MPTSRRIYMPAKETDLAALLIAVFAVGVSPLVATGAWTPVNTIICGPVLTVLWVYSLHAPERRGTTVTPERFAVAVVIGFIVSVGCSWPAQTIARGFNDHITPIDAYYWGLLPGCGITLILWLRWPGPRRKYNPNDNLRAIKSVVLRRRLHRKRISPRLTEQAGDRCDLTLP